MNRKELRKCIGRTFRFMPFPRRESSQGTSESDMNQWILRGETPDKKAFEFINAFQDHTPFALDDNQIRKFDGPDFLLLRGQVIFKDDAVTYEPFCQKPSSDILPTVLTMFIEDFEDGSVPTFTATPPFHSYKFCVKNTGQQTVRDFRSTLCIPQTFSLPSSPSYKSNLKLKNSITIKDTDYMIYENFTQAPIYKNDQVSVGELILNGEVGNHTLLWKIRCDDGTFPNEQEYGEINVCVVRLGDLIDEAARNVIKYPIKPPEGT